LIPSGGVIPNAATTQPMSLPRGSGNLKTARPPVPVPPVPRSTQRLVLGANTKTASMKALDPAVASSTVNLPVGMILRCLPPEVLAADIAQFESSGAAATEVALPMNTILNQLPTGRVEMTLQEIVAYLPPGFLHPTEAIVAFLPTLVSLPLMDVVMRIPPDLLSIRPDQKDVDAAVANMADPFTEETIREQAEEARREAGHANIVDESQVAAAEEFVPQATPPPVSNRPIIPPPRPVLSGGGGPPLPKVPAIPARPPVRVEDLQPNLPIRAPEPAPATPVDPAPAERPPLLAKSQSLSAAQGIPAPRPPNYRPTATQPTIPGFFSAKSPTSALPANPGQSGLILPRLTPPAEPAPVASEPETPIRAPEPAPAATVPSAVSETPAPSPAPTPDANVDDLQRLAALAMAQIGEEPVETGPLPKLTAPVPDPVQPESAVAATSKLTLPEAAPSPAETAPIVPADESSRLPNRPDLLRRSITTRVPTEPEPEALKPAGTPGGQPQAEEMKAPATSPAPEPPPAEANKPEAPVASAQDEPDADGAPASVAINLNSCTAEDLLPIPGVDRPLADAIVQHRAKIGEFRKLEDLLQVPGMTGAVYSELTGEAVPMGLHQSLNELLGFPAEQNVTLKDVTERISCWPDVTGCLLSQNSGLVLVGTVPDHLDKQAIVAFAPRMFEELNKSFSEITGRQTDDLVIPTTGTSFHILRDKDLYLTILCRVPQMPERHLKIARYVLTALSVRPR
jgi:competence ComEA-like helix-hairpin-helix protein